MLPAAIPRRLYDEEAFGDCYLESDNCFVLNNFELALALLEKHIAEQQFDKNETHWNCHDHRDELSVSGQCTVFHPEYGHLCWSERSWCNINMRYVIINHPIRFKDKPTAHKWIESGCIAEIQESLSILAVGFCVKTIELRKPYDD